MDNDGLLIICDKNKNNLHILTPDGKKLKSLNKAHDGSSFRSLSDVTCNNNQIYRTHRLTFIKKDKEATYVSWQGANTMVK